MGILSDEEKQEMKSLASSMQIREEFRRLRSACTPELDRPVDIGGYISFLTTMSRLLGTSSVPRRYIHYKNVKI